MMLLIKSGGLHFSTKARQILISAMQIFQFAPFQSFVSPSFWHKLSEIKLDHDRLSDAPKRIYGFYTNRSAKSCLLEVDYSSFNRNFHPPKYFHTSLGTLYNKNTIEDFKECDKNALLFDEGQKLLSDFKNGQVLENPHCLARFIILSFADLKSHCYYYWFAFPCPLEPSIKTKLSTPKKLQHIPELQQFAEILPSTILSDEQFFIIKLNKEKIFSLKECIQLEVPANNFAQDDLNEIYFCFADPSEYEHPSWLMRTYAAFLYYSCPTLLGHTIKFLGLRFNSLMQPYDSLIWEVTQDTNVNFIDDAVKFVGWEPNRNNRMGPRMVSMSDSMDSAKLAENSVILNLKLMKWRLLPDLDLQKIANTKCLLFGAGTLGCAVARNLLSWGFKTITLIDCGKVSFSNPVRQCLYTHDDAVKGNIKKATRAAERLIEINPSAITTGYVMQIPMPGHTIGESLQAQTHEDLNKIISLIKQHDALFLLTDSRESRWLPTMLGAAYKKIVINAALGFDSYLVMRHGCSNDSECKKETNEVCDIGDLKCILGSQLGCYFCNDVTAPGNSLKDRTLDQQCTVTRPGVSSIAASYAVELLVSLLQHPQGPQAPAYYCASGKTDVKAPEGMLGVIPHSIRGMISSYENILPATNKFTQCIACSEIVITEYKNQGNDFPFKVFESAKYLEDLTGISEYKNLQNEIIDFDEADLEMSEDD